MTSLMEVDYQMHLREYEKRRMWPLRQQGYFVSLSWESENTMLVECNIFVKDYDEETGIMDILLVDEVDPDYCHVCAPSASAAAAAAAADSSKTMACPVCGTTMARMVKRTYQGLFTIDEFRGMSATFVKSIDGPKFLPMTSEMIRILRYALRDAQRPLPDWIEDIRQKSILEQEAVWDDEEEWDYGSTYARAH